MSEIWDIYDINKNKTGRTAERDEYQFKEGEYHIVVTGIIINSKNEILITKRAPHKKFGLMWECNGGSILAGETSLEGIIRELKEELGITFDKKEAIFLKEIKRDKLPPDFKDLWLFRKDIDDKDITFPDGEAIEYKWVTIDEFTKMYNNKEIVPTIDFGKEEYELALKISQKEPCNHIEKYYENTKDSMPNYTTRKFIELKTKAGKAIELGCGAGRDTRFLLKNGWNVITIDREDVSKIIAENLSQEELKRLSFQKQEFENLKLEKNNLIVANFSLPFCHKDKFNQMWSKIKNSILPKGHFVGNFFGLNDEWAKTKKDMTFLSKEDVTKLFDEFEIINFKEIEKDGTTGLGKAKHWHIFNVIAQKR